jgi:predicted DNA-binding transcriptional regulator AlpA
MSSVVDEHVVMAPAEQARLALAARVRSLRRALEHVEAGRRDGLLMFSAPSPELQGLNDLDLLVLLLRDPTRLPQVPSNRIPGLVGLVRVFEAKLLWGELRPLAAPTPSVRPEESSDRLLTPQEAAQMLGVTRTWLYRRSHKLPFTRRLSRKILRFSEAGIRRYLATRART